MTGSISGHPIESQVAARDNTAAIGDSSVALRSSVGFVAVGGALAVTYRVTGWGLPCPFLAVTGWWCPLCGSTRLGARLLQGDVGGALYANPLLFVLLCMWVIALGIWALDAVRGSQPRRLFERWSQTQVYLALGIAFAVFTVVRNLA